MAAYATAADLAAFVSSDTTLPVTGELDRLLSRASELVDGYVTRPFNVDGNGAPTDTDVAATLRDATCATVEAWLELGEEHDIAGIRGDISTGPLSWQLPPTLPLRARRILDNAGLMQTVAV